MNDINGISLNKLPLQIQEFVGVLLFQEFPATTLYSDSKGMPLIKEWVDCSDEADRFFYYKSSKDNLESFIKGRLSQIELIKNSIDNIIYCADEIDGQLTNIKRISSFQIPEDYLPPKDSFFQTSNGVQLQKITAFFDLDNLETKSFLYLKERLKKSKKQVRKF